MCTDPVAGVYTEDPVTKEDSLEKTYYFRLYVTLNGTDKSTRATTELQTIAEKEINSITVFFTDINNNGNESNVSYKQTFGLQNATLQDDGSYLLSFRARIAAGKKKIYVAANLRDEQKNAFKNGSNCTYTCSDLKGTQQPVQKVMDIDSDGNGSNIVMFTNKGQEIIIDANPKADQVYQPDETFELVRVVSKVLLLFSNLEEDKYLKVMLYDGQTTGGTTYGWAPLTDVRYFLNSTNKKLFLMPQTEKVGETTYEADPNWKLGMFLSAVQGQNDLRMTNATAFAQNFKYYEATEMLPEWKDETTKSDVYYFNKMLRATPEEYVESKLTNNEYKTGLYCMENLVYNNTGVTDIDNSANLVSTYMVVATRFVPRYIWSVTKEDEKDVLQLKKYESPSDAYEGALKGQIDAENGTLFFPGTYWMLPVDYTSLSDEEKEKVSELNAAPNDGTVYLFYTYAGMILKIAKSNGTLSEENFVKHSAGLSYYTTYIDPEEETAREEDKVVSTTYATISYNARKAWGVRRNYHYTLVVSELSGLGASEPGTSPIKVRSCRVLNWNDKGSNTVQVLVTPTK
jgi:hypothetical protein